MHSVDDLQFVVDFETAEQAFDTQERVAEFARRRAPRIIDEVFEQHSREREVWRLELLDIDLGVVAHDDLESQWEARLRERLGEALLAQQAIARAQAGRPAPGHALDKPTAEPTAQVHSRPQAQLDTLLHFLRRGHLPWHAPQHLALASPLGQLAHEVLRDNAQALVHAWRASPEARLMVQRAARQFSPDWLARLAHELARGLGAGAAANWGRDAQAWIDGFAALWHESALRPAPAPHLLWQGLLSALWADAGVLDRSQPLHSMVQALAATEREQATVWHALQAVARRALDGTPPKPTATLSDALLSACLAARVPALAHVRDRDTEQLASAGSRSEEQARLLLRLHAWLPPNAHDDDPAPWQELLRAEASWARSTLLQLGRGPAARQRMAQALPPALLLALMALWLGPTERSLLQAATDDASLWGPAAAAPEPSLRWASTLSYVLGLPAPALFNGTDYLDHLLAQRAEREHCTVPALLHELHASWQHDHHRPAPTPLMRAWLRARLPAENAATGTRTQRRARLAAALSQGQLAGAEEDWFESLHHDAPWLQEQLRQAGRRPSVQRRMARDWSRLARSQLIGLWLLAPERAAVVAAIEDPLHAPLAGPGESRPGQALWEDLIAHLMRLTPGSFFHVDAYLRGLRERLAQLAPPESAHKQDTPRDDAAPAEHTWLVHLSPAEQVMLRQELHLVQQAAQRAGLPASDESLSRLAWAFARRELVDDGRRYEPVSFPVRLARHLVDALHLPEPDAWLTRLAREAGRQKTPATAPRIAAAMASAAAAMQPSAPATASASAPAAAPVTRTPPPPPEPPPLRFEDLLQPRETVHVASAGIVLAGAYLPRLFGMLQLTRDEAFVSPAAAERAVLLMHHLATGSIEAPEPQLAVHKVLCGLSLSVPLVAEFRPTPEETSAVDGLLQAMIAHWKVIGHTSVAGLRESFLQREGRLGFDAEDGWQLTVEPRSFDMLLDHLPWGYGLQKFPWMERPLHVEWR